VYYICNTQQLDIGRDFVDLNYIKTPIKVPYNSFNDKEVCIMFVFCVSHAVILTDTLVVVRMEINASLLLYFTDDVNTFPLIVRKLQILGLPIQPLEDQLKEEKKTISKLNILQLS
jgi:hypothetical protein